MFNLKLSIAFYFFICIFIKSAIVENNTILKNFNTYKKYLAITSKYKEIADQVFDRLEELAQDVAIDSYDEIFIPISEAAKKEYQKNWD